jgi:hypothetical protein
MKHSGEPERCFGTFEKSFNHPILVTQRYLNRASKTYFGLLNKNGRLNPYGFGECPHDHDDDDVLLNNEPAAATASVVVVVVVVVLGRAKMKTDPLCPRVMRKS